MSYDDFFWNLFERYGSLDAYMGYRTYRYQGEGPAWEPFLNENE